jgi:hypothetical protein
MILKSGSSYVGFMAQREMGEDTEHAPPLSYNLAFAVQLKKITEKLRRVEKSWTVS